MTDDHQREAARSLSQIEELLAEQIEIGNEIVELLKGNATKPVPEEPTPTWSYEPAPETAGDPLATYEPVGIETLGRALWVAHGYAETLWSRQPNEIKQRWYYRATELGNHLGGLYTQT
jgi:hypothetical protein